MIALALAILAQGAPVTHAPGYAVALPTVPGKANPNVTQATIRSTICVPLWTSKVRPPTSYTNKIKFALMDAQHIPRSDARQFELDHMLPIEDGGDPSSPLNLWLQPFRGKYCTKWCSQDKDVLETFEKRGICKGTISLAAAQHELQTDWIAGYISHHLGKSP
jgi:hypothetical protein